MKFNRKQKIIVVIAIFFVAAMVIYPPWVLSSKFIGQLTTRSGPYAFICLPPESARFIDLYRLVAQLVGILVIGTGLCFVCNTKKGDR